MFGGSGPHTKRPTHHQTRDTGNGPEAPVRFPSVKAPVRKLSSVVVSLSVTLDLDRSADVVVQPEAVNTALPPVNVVRLPGPVAIEGIESPRVTVPPWIPNLPTHPHPADLLEESSFAPCQPRRKSSS